MILVALMGPNLGAVRSRVMTLAVAKKSGGSLRMLESVTSPLAQVGLEPSAQDAHAVALF